MEKIIICFRTFIISEIIHPQDTCACTIIGEEGVSRTLICTRIVHTLLLKQYMYNHVFSQALTLIPVIMIIFQKRIQVNRIIRHLVRGQIFIIAPIVYLVMR